MPKKYSRYQANRLILAKLDKLVEKYPDWRFNQILSNAGVTFDGQDMFYDESVETLERLEEFENEVDNT